MRAITQVIKSKSFSSLIGNGLGALLGLFTFASLARFLDKSDFGSWIVFLALYGIFDTLRIGLVLNALVKNLAGSKTPEKGQQVIGSSFLISLIVTGIYLLLVGIGYVVFQAFHILPGYLYFFKWFALVAMFTLPHNFATWLLNAKLRIISMSFIRILNQLLFLGFVWFFIRFNPSLENVMLGYTLTHFMVSVLCLFIGWSGLKYIYQSTKEILATIFHFGKFSMGTLIGANLLRSSDTFIISNMLGSGGVATYNVSTRLNEIIEMPLRSFAVTALPEYAKMFANGQHKELKEVFERRTGLIFFILFPISLFCFLLANWVIYLIGGLGYADSVIILRLFAPYMAIMPLDKFSGVLLDTINKPHINFMKVTLMVLVNVVGDCIGILIFGNLEAVAFVSTLSFLTGVFFGYYHLKKHLGIRIRNVFYYGWDEFKFWTKKIIANGR
jgi:O-antigen/teichoic acid export membrane protein